MSLKSFIVSGVIGLGFLGFIIGVPSPQVLILQDFLGTTPTVGYFGQCTDKNSGCSQNSAATYHCAKGDRPVLDYNYPTDFSYLGDKDFCQRVVAAEAFGIMAIVFSFAAIWAALFHKYTHRHAGATSAFIAAIFGVIALGVYFGGDWKAADGNDPTVSKAVQNNTFKLGYSAGLQIVGVICCFFGSLLSTVAGKF